MNSHQNLRLLSIATGLLTTFASITSSAFTLSSSTDPNAQGWGSPEVKFMVNATNCPAGIDVPGLVAEVSAAWNNVPTSNVKVSYGGTTTSTTDSNPPTVYCETNFGTVTSSDQNFVVGAGRSSSTVASGPKTSGLLILNVSSGTGNISNHSSNSLKIIMAHEIGHVLGLGHSQDSSALMYYDASAKTNFLLSQDDMDGISYLYPRDELGSDQMLGGCGTIKNVTPPPGTSGSLAVLLTMPILIGLWLRRRYWRIQIS